jgi:hypothetical protein
MKRWIVALGLAAAACSKAPSEDQCKQLLDHLVDLEFKKAGTQATTDQMKTDLAKQKSAVADAKSAEFLETCKTKTSRARVECAINAADLDPGVADCDK